MPICCRNRRVTRALLNFIEAHMPRLAFHARAIPLRSCRSPTSEATATALLTEDLTGWQRGAIAAVCTDMHRPYLNAVATALPKAEVVFDKFHVLQHASAALDEVRRQEFFRARARSCARTAAGSGGCCCAAGRRSAARSARNSRRCLLRIVGCSKPIHLRQALPAERLEPSHQEIEDAWSRLVGPEPIELLPWVTSS